MTQKVDDSIGAFARQAIRRGGLEDCREDIRDIAQHVGVTRVVLEDLGALDAYIERTFGGLVVTINRDRSRFRQRFSLAHEVGHILIGDESGHRGFQTSRAETELDHEIICDAIAAELLMPSKPFSAALGKGPPNIARILRVASAFSTSIEATARRVTEVSVEPILIAFWEIRRRGVGDMPALRYARRSASMEGTYLPKNFVPIRSTSPYIAAGSGDVVVREESLIPAREPQRRRVESKRFGDAYIMSVISPVTLDQIKEEPRHS